MRDLGKWRSEQKKLGMVMVASKLGMDMGVARLFLASAELVQDSSTGNLKSVLFELANPCKWLHSTKFANAAADMFASKIVKLFAMWNLKATISRGEINGIIRSVPCFSIEKSEGSNPVRVSNI